MRKSIAFVVGVVAVAVLGVGTAFVMTTPPRPGSAAAEGYQIPVYWQGILVTGKTF